MPFVFTHLRPCAPMGHPYFEHTYDCVHQGHALGGPAYWIPLQGTILNSSTQQTINSAIIYTLTTVCTKDNRHGTPLPLAHLQLCAYPYFFYTLTAVCTKDNRHGTPLPSWTVCSHETPLLFFNTPTTVCTRATLLVDQPTGSRSRSGSPAA